MSSFKKSQKKFSSSARTGLALIITSMFFISCAPSNRALPLATGEFPQRFSDGQGNTIPGGGQDLSFVQPADWNAVRGNYSGTLYDYTDTQDYSIALTEKNLNGQRYAYLEFRSNGSLGPVNFGAYMQSVPSPTQLTAGVTHYYFSSSQVPAEMLENWVASPVSLTLLLGVRTNPNGSKSFDPTQSLIYILDCAVSVGVDSCSNQYDYQTAGFLNDFRKR